MKTQTENQIDDQNGNKSKPLLSSRLFKFRAWCPSLNEMVHITDLHFDEGMIGFESKENKDVWNNENFVLMQFTGLKDKKGTEIYESDILKITLYDDEWKTKVRDYYGTFIIDVEGCDWNTTALSFLDDEAETEIIGNIFENPELL